MYGQGLRSKLNVCLHGSFRKINYKLEFSSLGMKKGRLIERIHNAETNMWLEIDLIQKKFFGKQRIPSL
jgi:hypothetical protein